MTDLAQRAQNYLDWLGQLTDGAEPRMWSADPDDDPTRRVLGLGYRNLPEDGVLTGFTYGLSLRHQAAWTTARPELSITVRSDDPTWVLALAHLAANLGDVCPFTHLSMVDMGMPITDDTRMDGFVVFAPSVLPGDTARVQIDDSLPVQVVGVYPCYASERELISEKGFEAFWQRDFDAWDVHRDPVA